MTNIELVCVKYEDMSLSEGANRYDLLVRANSIPYGLFDWRDINPRMINEKSFLIKDIVDTLINKPEMFQYYNKGLYIYAKDIVVKNGRATITLADKSLHGVGDGAHTLYAIQRASLKKTISDECLIPVVVFTNFSRENTINSVVNLNKTVQVKKLSLEEIQGSFEYLKTLIKDEPFADRVVYKTNQKIIGRSIQIDELINHIMVFNKDWYPHDAQYLSKVDSQIVHYGQTQRILDKFVRDANINQTLSNMSNILSDIFKIWDRLECDIPKVSKVRNYLMSTPWSIYSLDGHKTLYYSNNTSFMIPNGLIYPMFSAFKALLMVDDNGIYYWHVNPLEIMDDTINSFARILLSGIKKMKPNTYGKHKETYWRYAVDTITTNLIMQGGGE